ncbi:hypothetical protein JCM14635_15540 [Megalodesulfovibrio paquesii]
MRRVEQVAESQSLTLLKATGATMVMAGTKQTGGQDTGRPALVVAVPQKRPLADIPEAARVPGTVAGVVTDVIELPRPAARPRLGCPTAEGLGCDRAIERHRPLTGGVSMFHTRWPWALAAAGTLGAIVRDASPDGNGALMGLSNNHCLGLAYDPAYGVPWYGLPQSGLAPAEQVEVLQPAGLDLGNPATDRIGTVARLQPLAFFESTSLTDPGGVPLVYLDNPAALRRFPQAPANAVDAGLVRLDPGLEAGWGMLEITPGPLPFATKSEVTLGLPIYKAGRSTGRVPNAAAGILGTIASLAVTVDVDYGGQYARLPGWEEDGPRLAGLNSDTRPYKETLAATLAGQMLFVPASGSASTVTNLPGDSGSVVLGLIGGQFKIIGLYHSGVSEGAGAGYGFFTPIWTVANRLKIEACDYLLSPPAPGEQVFFGVACQMNASGGLVTPSALRPPDATPGAPAPLIPDTISAPAAGSLTRLVRHAGDCMQISMPGKTLAHNAALLRLGSWPEPPATCSWFGCLIFESLAIPQGAHLVSASLVLTIATDPVAECTAAQGLDRAFFNPEGAITCRVQAGAVDDAVRPRTYSALSNTPRTQTFVSWTIPAGPPGSATPGPRPLESFTSPDLAAMLQEVVNRPGWQPGHSLMLQLTTQTTADVSMVAVGLGDKAPVLRVAWGEDV